MCSTFLGSRNKQLTSDQGRKNLLRPEAVEEVGGRPIGRDSTGSVWLPPLPPPLPTVLIELPREKAP